MKRLFFLILAIDLTIGACGATATQTRTSPQTSFPISPTTGTNTPTATATMILPTSTITPLPTIPTFTPTFDVRTIVTVTPAEKAECPIKSDKAIDIIPFDEKKVSNIQEALNQGIPLIAILKAVKKGATLYYIDHGLKGLPEVYIPPVEKDLTNDGNPEIIIPNAEGANLVYYMLGCKKQKYDILFSIDNEGMYSMNLQFINDANKNGLPEMLFSEGRCDFGGCTGNIKVIEWNGMTMKIVLDEENLETFFKSISIEDLDKDGLKEFLWLDHNSSIDSLVLSRVEKHVYKWNGTIFAPLSIEYTSPKFRFQALQDADSYVLENKYDTALSIYQDAIFSDKLDWWSPNRYDYQFEFVIAKNNNLPTPTPVSPDVTEYPKLAAYAYYRIMLLHLVQGHDPEAVTAYNTLQQKFASDQYGQPYVEMAAAFWDAYQSTHTMYSGCAAAIQYAAEHPKILIPLGSDYHGATSHRYVPEDVCPFR